MTAKCFIQWKEILFQKKLKNLYYLRKAMAEWKKYIEMTKQKMPQKIREEKLKRSFIDSLKKKK